MSLGQDDQAIEDLEEANTLDPGRTHALLLNGLEHRRASAQSQRDIDTERHVTMRLADLFVRDGNETSAVAG